MVDPLRGYELPALEEGFSLIREQPRISPTAGLQGGGSVARPCEGLYRLGRFWEGLAVCPSADALTRVEEALPAFGVEVVARAVLK